MNTTPDLDQPGRPAVRPRPDLPGDPRPERTRPPGRRLRPRRHPARAAHRHAWGTIWTRPGLDRRSRSLITLTALVARGHHEELAAHLRAALRNGLIREEIKELLLQTAIDCGVPDANAAFRVAQEVLGP